MSPGTHAHQRATRLVAVAAAACLALTACGDDSDASSGTDSGSGANLTGEPIKIGYAASQSGPQASNGLNGAGVAQAWAKHTNANGGVDGHPVEFEIVDTKNTVPGATSVVQNFLDDDEIDAILLTDLVAEGAMGKMLTDVDTPILSGGGSSDLLWSTVPGAFQPVSGSNYTVKAYVQVAKAVGAAGSPGPPAPRWPSARRTAARRSRTPRRSACRRRTCSSSPRRPPTTPPSACRTSARAST
ncbi:hypothetical protein Psuf_071280 [Phytohabitans suffuscus]|uniref:Leucine-binding protein domain-containing protein n=1 Tax=Phytohabitans suffuscus TaxID=624315 RepID=A0A6F8YUG0_9ACTN|nr:hypothetical protein Psuf_071280 [Phytohabitans suffuscus]